MTPIFPWTDANGRIDGIGRFGIALFVIVAAIFACAAIAAAQDRIRVYVSPPAAVDGFVDDELQGQRDTVADLTERLAKNARFDIVKDAASADVTIEVVGRGRRETGEERTLTMRTPIGLVGRTEPDETKAVTIVLRSGDYTKEFSAMNDQVFGAWKAIAGRLAKEIEKWVRANEQTLLARRTA